MEKIIKGTELADKLLRVMEDGSLRIVETGKFIPKDGEERYYYLNSCGDIATSIYVNQWRLKHSILFRAESECMEYKAFLELLDEYSREFVKGEANYHFNIDYNGSVAIGYRTENQSEGTFFDSRDKAQEFINKVGELTIKKFMFDIWD